MKRSKSIRTLAVGFFAAFVQIMVASAALHHFEIKLPEKVKAGVETTIIIKARSENRAESMNQDVTVTAECRAEKIEKTVMMRRGEATVKMTFGYTKPYIITAKTGEGANEIFTTANLEVKP